MAHSVSARKRIRQNVRHRARNRWRMRKMRDALKDFQDKLLHGSVDEAKASLKTASQILDRTAHHNCIHKNQAARRKSRMNASLKARIQAGS